MRKSFFALATIGAIFLAGCSGAQNTATTSPETTATDDSSAVVSRVIDGDTVDVVLTGDTGTTRVRLLNIDTPETKDPQETVQCMGPEASQYLEKTLTEGTKIKLEYDVDRTDKYDRVLAGIFLTDDTFVNEEIARNGFGTAALFKPNSKFYQRVLEAEQEAQKNKKGLFDPTIGCTLPAQIQKANQALSADPAQAEEAIKESKALLAALATYDSDTYPWLKTIIATTAVSQAVKTLTTSTENTQKAVENRKEEAKAQEKAAADQAAREQKEREEAARVAEANRVATEQEAAQKAQTEQAPASQPQNFYQAPAQQAPAAPAGTPFKNCAEARAAGMSNIPIGSPYYNPKSDGDNDGIACESK